MVKDGDFDGTMLLFRPGSPSFGLLVAVYGDVACLGGFNRAGGHLCERRAAGGE